MPGLLTYTLATKSVDDRWLRDTVEQYNRACEHISEFAIKKSEFVSNNLDAELGELLKKKFRLPSGLAKTAVQRVSRNYHDIPVRERTKREKMPHYEGGGVVIYNKDTASLLMRAIPVNHTAKFPFRLSISVTNDNKNKTRRILVGFVTKYEPDGADEKTPTMRLIFNEEIGKWQFLVVIKKVSDEPRPEFLETRDESHTPSPQSIDWDYTPPEDEEDACWEDVCDNFTPEEDLDDGIPSDVELE